MKLLSCSIVSTFALVAASSLATAADLSSLKGASVLEPAPPANWAGFYVGAFGGANFLAAKTLGFGGLRAGYNWQFDRFVVGVQAEGDLRPDSSNSVTNWIGKNTGTHYQANYGSTANFISTFAARAGYELADHFLPFISGGLAVSDLGLNTTVNGLTGPNAGAYGANSLDTTRVGWTLGGGFEYALTRNWSLDAQYQYYRFSPVTLATPVYIRAFPVTSFNFRDIGFGNLVSLGANYHF